MRIASRPLLRLRLGRSLTRSCLTLVVTFLSFQFGADAQAIDTATLSTFQQNRSNALTGSLFESASSTLFASGLVLGAGAETKAAEPIEFKLTSLDPFAYNSNATGLPQNGYGAGHGTPELLLEGTEKFDALKLTLYGALDASFDRYVNTPFADADNSNAVVRATLGDPNDDQAYKLFFDYKPSLNFDPTFAALKSTSNKFELGLTKGFAFDDFWQRIPDVPGLNGSTGLNGGTYNFIFQTVAGRSLSSSVSSDYLKASFEFDYSINYYWALQVQANVQDTRYDAENGSHRNDVSLSPNLTLAYALPQTWFGDKEIEDSLGSPEIDFQIGYGNNLSNVGAKRFHQWNLGPVLHHTWKL